MRARIRDLCFATISTMSWWATAQPAPGPPVLQVATDDRPSEELNWPEAAGKRKKEHWFAFGQIGSCTRDDSRVAAADWCGEISPFGVEIPFRGRPLRFSVELAFGTMKKMESGDASGILRSSGGHYLAIRPLLGVDITRLFFMRFGPQLRATWSLDTVAPGVMGVIDLGTRLGSRLEIGPRAFFGVDDVVSVGPDGTHHDFAVAFGTTLHARVIFQ